MSDKKVKATETIEVTSYVPSPYDTGEVGPVLNEIRVVETFKGDTTGQGKVRFLQAATADGSASFVGIERVMSALAGRKGSFLLQDEGTLKGDQVQGCRLVVAGSGTGELAGLRGDGTFAAKLGEHAHWTLDCWYE